MFIRKAVIENIRSIENLEWESPKGERASWNVILGDNGSGKSSFPRAVALALIGPKEAAAARQDWKTWVRAGEEFGSVVLYVVRDGQFDSFSPKTRKVGISSLTAGVIVLDFHVGAFETRSRPSPEGHIWGTGSGWFSAAYGPFRRFAGGDKEADRLFQSNPKLGAHISVFGENVALTASLQWLKDLNYKKLEHSPEGHLLNRLKHFVNQDGFLPPQY